MGKHADVHIVGYKHSHVSFHSYEVTTRLPLLIIAWFIIDQMVNASGDAERL